MEKKNETTAVNLAFELQITMAWEKERVFQFRNYCIQCLYLYKAMFK